MILRSSAAWLKRALPLIRTIIVLILLIPIGYAIYQQWLGVRTTLYAVDWRQFLTSLLVLMLAQPLMGLISWVVLRNLNQRFPFLRITAIYFISQAAKYLPGGIWAFPGRVVAYQAIGVERMASVISLIQEVGALFLGAATIGLLGLVGGLLIPEWVRLAIFVGIGACILVIFLAQLPWPWQILARIGLLRNTALAGLSLAQSKASLRGLPVSFLVSCGFWLVVGSAFQILAKGVSENAGQLTWLQASSTFSLAWCAGFVIVFAPAGLGVRETALSGLLLNYMPASEALSLALMARLWWTLGEAGFVVLSILWVSGKLPLQMQRKTAPDNQKRDGIGEVIER